MRYIVNNNYEDISLDGILEYMYDTEIFVHTEFSWDKFYEKSEKYLADYLLKDHNDVCLSDEAGHIPNINDELIKNNTDKSIVQLFEFDKLKHEFGIDLDEYMTENLSYEKKKNKLSDERTNTIRKMYDYNATEAKSSMVPSTKEEIGNWYIVGFPKIEDLERVFNIEDVYDLDIDYKIEVADIDKKYRW